MKIRDTFRRSGRSLKSAKLRTLLTALAIAVGAFTLTLTLAASNGLRSYTDKLISSNFDPAELLVGRDKEIANTGEPGSEPQEYDSSVGTIQAGGQSAGLQLKRLTLADIEKLKQKSYVEQVRENFTINIRYISREGQKQYTGAVQAFNPAQKPELAVGKFADSDIEAGTAILPDSYIKLLGFKDEADALGKTVEVSVQKAFSESSLSSLLSSFQAGVNPLELAKASQPEAKSVSYKIAGVSKKSTVSFAIGVQPVLIGSGDARALYDFTANGTNDYNKFLYASVRIRDGAKDSSKVDAAKTELEKDGFYSIGVKDLQKTITQFVDILTIMVGVFGLITVIASVFGIVNTQYISVLERTREIGLMKALGMSRGSVSQLFSFEATWIGFLGGLLGSVIGFVVGNILNPVISKKLKLGDGINLLTFKPSQMLLLIVALMLVATIAGLLPARKAAKLNPIEALRTE